MGKRKNLEQLINDKKPKEPGVHLGANIPQSMRNDLHTISSELGISMNKMVTAMLKDGIEAYRELKKGKK